MIFKVAQNPPQAPPVQNPQVPVQSQPATNTPVSQAPEQKQEVPPAGKDINSTETLKELFNGLDPQLLNQFSTLDSNIKQLEAQKSQDNNLFETSKGNCAVFRFAPKVFGGSPCDFLTTVGVDLAQSSSLQEVEQYYNKYVKDLPELLSKYNEMSKLLDGAKLRLEQNKNNSLQNYQPGVAAIAAAKSEFWNKIVSIQTEQQNVVRQNQPLLTPINGRSVLDCYEEIIDLMTDLCEKSYQPLQKSFSTLGIGPVAIYARQLVTGYQDVIRIYTQELGPMYKELLSQQQNTDQKRVQFILNQITKIVPQSYQVQIIAIKTGLFDITAKNDPTKLKAALHM